MIKRLFLLFLSILLVLSCQQKGSDIIIGVHQTTQHPLLDEAYEGFLDIMEEHNRYRITFRNANGDFIIADQINNQFINQNVDLIVALGTPAAQSAFQSIQDKRSKIPLVFGVITDPVLAGLAEDYDSPGGNKTGTSDRWPYEQQVELINLVLPDVKRVGVLVNLGEDNCVAGMKIIRKAAHEKGLELIERPINTSADIRLAASSLVRNSDAFLISPSNTLFEGLSTFLQIAEDNGIPVFGGEKNAVTQGALISYAPNYFDIGRQTAEIVLKIIEENKDPGEIPVAITENAELIINKATAKIFNIEFPKTLLENATIIE